MPENRASNARPFCPEEVVVIRVRPRSTRTAIPAVMGLMVAIVVGVLTFGGAAAATPPAVAASATAKSGTVTLTKASGSISGTLGLAVVPAAGSGVQTCDPANPAFAVVYLAAVGDEYGVAGGSVNYTILAPADGSLLPAGGTLTQFLPTVVPPAFPATGGDTPIDGKTKGTFSLGVRCQDESSTQIFQNYWTTITVNDGTWTLGGAVPTTPSTATSPTSGPTTPPTTDSATSPSVTTSPDPSSTSSSGPSKPTRSGTLLIAPASGNLLTGKHTLTAVPAAGSAAQPCGDVQAFALLYFTPVGDEYVPAGKQGAVLKARPLQAAGLDIPVGGTLVDFLVSVGSVDFSQSLGASDSWQQSLGAGKYSMGVRCQSGTASDPIIYQNYFSTVDVAGDGTWAVEGATSTTTAPTTGSTTTPTTAPSTGSTTAPSTGSTTTGPRSTPTTPAPAVAVLDDAGHRLSNPVTVKQGQRVFVSATGFDQSEPVTVAIHSEPITLASVSAVNGGIATQITIPAALPVGAHVLSFTGASSRRVGNLDIVVASVQAGTTSTPTTTSGVVTSSTGTSSTNPSLTTPSVSTRSSDGTSTSMPWSTGNGYSYGTGTSALPTPFSDTSNGGANGYGGGTASPQGALAYTGYPVSNSFDLSLLLLGSGIGVLALTSGSTAPVRRHQGRDRAPRRGAHTGSRRGA